MGFVAAPGIDCIAHKGIVFRKLVRKAAGGRAADIAYIAKQDQQAAVGKAVDKDMRSARLPEREDTAGPQMRREAGNPAAAAFAGELAAASRAAAEKQPQMVVASAVSEELPESEYYLSPFDILRAVLLHFRLRPPLYFWKGRGV